MENTKPKPKPKTSKNYFSAETQDAIMQYVASSDPVERERLYKTHMNHAFDKLAEILIHKGKFYYAGPNMAEIKSDVIMHILEKLNNFKADKGKAYSYFTVIAWRFLINQNNGNYHKLKNRVSTDYYIDDVKNEAVLCERPAESDHYQFFEEFTEYLDNNLSLIFPRKKDTVIANALLEIIKRRDSIGNFNKKALYIYIREMTDCKSSQITAVTNIFKNSYIKAWDDYLNNGCLSMNKIYK